MDNPWATDVDPVPPDSDWAAPWASPETAPPSPDQWEAARRETESLSRAAPPEWLDTLLYRCQQSSQEIWPAPESEPTDERSWKSGFDDVADIAALLAQLVPLDPTLPPTVQFSATATAKAMNEALKLTRHLPSSASGPLSRLLTSKGSLEWQKSIKATQEHVPDAAHVGWRVLEKEDRLGTVEDSKPKKATSGFLSFWNRRTSTIQTPLAETTNDRSGSPAGSSLENAKSVSRPPSSRAASPPKTSPSVPEPPRVDSSSTVVANAPAPSAVTRFLYRFSRTRSTQHGALALSSDDLEFLSDIVPSASDPLDEDIDDSALATLTGASSSSLPPKLPPPIPPPAKQPIFPNSSSSALVLGAGSTPPIFQAEGAGHTANVPVLAAPLSPKPVGLPSYTPSPSSPKDAVISSVQQRLQTSSRPNSLPQPPLSLQMDSLSIPPLLPPPAVSPPQTPRPGTLSSITTLGHSSTIQRSDSCNPHESDDEFTEFASFPPPPPAPFPSLDAQPLERSPSPPSPPPHRTYERTHYPSSSSTSSTFGPASQSADQLCLTRPSISASLDGFDDPVSPPLVAHGENGKHASPSPPPLPAKPRWQRRQPPNIDTYRSLIHHAHTPSQTTASPTVHTSLMTEAFSMPSVRDAERQRTQALVNHAATRGGLLWPNSPDMDQPEVRAIPPPPSSSASPRSVEGFDLLDDGDNLGSLEVLPAPLGVVGAAGMDPIGASSGVAGGPGKGLGLRNQLQPTPPPLSSTFASILSFSSLGTSTTANAGSLQPAKPKQTGGLSAQDLSFFEGL